MSKEKELKQHLQQYDKDVLIELYLQKDFDTKQQLAECKEKLEESFCQEDVEGLIKDRDITIKSLKEQLTGYQQELETYKKKPINVYQMEIRNLQVDKAELKLEIEEKDEMIKELKQVCEEYKMASPTLEDFENVQKAIRKDLRHQICEKIREFIEQPENSIFYDTSLYVETEGLRKFLDQIEKGE